MDKPKTYKRETAWAMAFFNAALFLWGLIALREDVVEVAKFLTTFTVTALSAALFADFKAKQM
jgi:hypothetical protein